MGNPEAPSICQRVARRRAELAGRASSRTHLLDAITYTSGAVFSDLVACGVAALVRHTAMRLDRRPVRTIHVDEFMTRIRVLGAIDYVVDRRLRRVYAEPSPLSGPERKSTVHPPWSHPAPRPLSDIDILKPLCKPMCLAYVAARTGWFEFPFAGSGAGQRGLFLSNTDGQYALEVVSHRCYWMFADTLPFLQLQADLLDTLSCQIDPRLMDLAIRARPFTRFRGLNAQHLNRVWQSREMFEQVQRENPRLLPAVSAWRGAHVPDTSTLDSDPVAVMRRQLLAEGLSPRAWRHLARHGTRNLLPDQARKTAWSHLVRSLSALEEADWPAAPISAVELLFDTAGPPTVGGWSDTGAPVWFWRMLLQHAARVKSHAGEYTEFLAAAVQWAFWARRANLMPDPNQLRAGIPWLAKWCENHASRDALNSSRVWLQWLPQAPVIAESRWKAIPLRSAAAVFDEAIALHNCADGLIEKCALESVVLISLRNAIGKRRALAEYSRVDGTWICTEVKGPCNRPPTPEERRVAVLCEKALAEWTCKIPAI